MHLLADQHAKDKTKFNNQKDLLKMQTDNSVEYCGSLSHENYEKKNMEDHS